MKKHLLFFALIGSTPDALYATTLLRGNNAQSPLSSNSAYTTLSFSQRVTAKAFDHTSGTLFLGLANDGPTSSQDTSNLKIAPGAYTITKTARPAGTSSLQATPFAPSNLQNKQVDFLAISTFPENTEPNLVVAEAPTGDISNNETVVDIISFNGKITQESPPLLGYTAVFGAPGQPVSGVLNIAANRDTVFVITGSETKDDTQVKDIAVLSIANQTLQLEQQAAVATDPGVKAQQLHPANFEPSPVTIQGTTETTQDLASIYWDEPLQRLYVGLQLATAAVLPVNPGDGGRSVVVGYTNADKNLFLVDFVPDAAVVNGDETNIVAVRQGGTGTPLNVSAAQLNVLHASTGPSYLIVHGGNGTVSYYDYTADQTVSPYPPRVEGTTGNTIWAIPLVDLQDPTNAAQGVEANKNAFNTTTHLFDTPAVNNADLTNTSDLFAAVGNGPLPLDPKTPVWGFGGGSIKNGSKTVVIGQNTLDIQVVGDTVYVAISTPQTLTDDTGVYYSQALFDEEGKILQWTPWAKRAFPYDAFLNTPKPTSTVRYVAVDPTIGKVWASDGDLSQTVRLTSWTQQPNLSTLPAAVNTATCRGCFSVLDLDSSTTGFDGNTANRYTLFGGVGRVIFTRTATALSTSMDSPQTPVTDFADPKNFLVSKLPSGAGGVTVLEYSRQVPPNSNYFFAGTASGLYVFSDSGNGFLSSELGTLDAAPFSTGSWQHIDNLFGAVVDIKTIGNSIYVLYVDTVNIKQPVYRLFRMIAQATVSDMIAGAVLIAQSNSGNLGSTLAFYGIQVIATNETGTQEQVVLATNNGLYQTATAGGSQTANNQSDAAWQLIAAPGSQLFTGIAGVNAPVPSMAWPLSQQDPTGKKIYNTGLVSQLIGGIDGGIAGPFQLLPAQFNALSNDPVFQMISPISNFWSDGGRRFFILQSNCKGLLVQELLAMPYDVAQWGVTRPAVLTDPIFETVGTLYWIQQIGATGIVMAGTNSGVIALE